VISVFERVGPQPCFSKKEKQILKLIAEGFSNNEIAKKLFIAIETVKKHRQNILNKTDCKNTGRFFDQRKINAGVS